MGRINLGQRAGITPTPMLLIGTYNDDGTPNAMVATWGVTATWEVVELNLYKVRKIIWVRFPGRNARIRFRAQGLPR